MSPVDSQQTEDLCEEAFQLCLHGDYAESFKLYKKILFEVGDQSAGILSEAGFVCRQMGIVDEADECFRRALEQDPYHRETLINYVDMLLSFGSADEKTGGFLKCLVDIDPGSADVKVIVAKKCVLQNDRTLARAVLQEVLNEHPGEANIAILGAKTLLETAFSRMWSICASLTLMAKARSLRIYTDRHCWAWIGRQPLRPSIIAP